ncbi:phospholipid scramblase 1-like isoform X4 [Acipenser ruthenus]|uniref:phospholipid scramblase 1-like isoform X4 n=1 Tax=Acipenser ruthenus TaxID=7906 RepID=UPI002740A408|nr:phospholipid scramblase 1-like isoform X4 [Acipenser ruthenus]
MGKVMAAIGQYSFPSYGPVSFPQIPTSASIAQQGPAPQIGHSPALHVVYRAAPVRNAAAPTPGPVAQLMGLNPSIGLVGQWMPLPADPPPDCPPGLEYLSVVDQILIHQVPDRTQGNRTRNRYELRNGLGQRIYYALEDPSSAVGDLCRNTRGFTLSVQDCKLCNVMQIFRPCRSPTRWCPGCLETVLGSDNVTVVGKISNKFTGVAAEYFTNSDSFGVQFPVDLDVTIKATLIGASFLIVRVPETIKVLKTGFVK